MPALSRSSQPLRSLPLREGVDLNFSSKQPASQDFRLPLREGVDLNKPLASDSNTLDVSLCVREWI